MFKILGLISGLFGVVKAAFAFFSGRRLIELGVDRAVIKGHEEGDHAISEGKAARDAARGAPSGSLHDDDGFKRDN